MLDSLRRLIFPKDVVCLLCFKEAIVNELHICESCSRKLKRYHHRIRTNSIIELRSALVYEESLKYAMSRFKYCDSAYIADFFGECMEIPSYWRIDCVVPVPLTRKRFIERGYNQSAELAVRICKRYGLEMKEELLVRVRETFSQTNLCASERRKNIIGAFKAGDVCEGMSILLIDDIVTTKSTLNECARTLIEAGANKVYALTACLTTIYKHSEL